MPKVLNDHVISVRMPKGAVRELNAATGVPFGTLVRFNMLALLTRLRRERDTPLPDPEAEAMKAIGEVVEAMPATQLYGEQK